MEKIKDIKKNLEKDVNIERFYEKKEIEVSYELGDENIAKDIYLSSTDQKIDLRKEKNIKIIKNNTKNFDSLTKNKKLKNIDIQNPPKIAEILKSKFSAQNPKKSLKKFFYKAKNTKISPAKIGLLVIALLFLLLADKIIVENLVNSGYKKIISIKQSQKALNEIKKQLNDAKLDFIIADILFKPFLLIPSNDVKNGYHIIKGGKEITKLGDELLQIYSEIKALSDKKGIENISLTNLMLNSTNDFLQIKKHLEQALNNYNKISILKNPDLNKKLKKQKENLEAIVNITKVINSDFNNIIELLGHSKEKKYLIIFQNNDEIRPTGGFMGSMAIATIIQGKIKSFEPKDIYAYEWNLKKSDHKRIKPPKAIKKLTNTFGLRDANYFINIKDSSETIKYFIEKAGYKIDAIVYVNQNTIIDFLEKTGNINSKTIGETINAQNFSRTISTLVEAKISKKGTLGTPKKILFNFIEDFKKTLKQKADYISYISIILDNLKRREIIIHSFDKNINETLKSIGINGNINYEETLDFSYPVFTSISGNKSDRYIKRKYEKNITQNSDCSIDTRLKISLSHLFTKKEENKIKNILKKYNLKEEKNLIKIQGGGDNYSFIKVLLPKNAKIQKKKSIEIVELQNKKSVEFFMKTRSLETTSFEIKYSLENKNCKKYDFKLYKQPGIKPYEVKIVDGRELLRNSGIKEDYYYSKD